MVSTAVRVGFKPTFRITRSDPGVSKAAATKNAAEERSPGTCALRECSRAGPRTEMVPFVRVIARGHRFFHSGFSFGYESGKQNGCFHLRARSRRPMINRMEVSPHNPQRWEPALRGFNSRAHARKRIYNASHGAARKRSVSDKAGFELLSGKNTGQHSHG